MPPRVSIARHRGKIACRAALLADYVDETTPGSSKDGFFHSVLNYPVHKTRQSLLSNTRLASP